jgi:hypothetical protein
MERLRDQIDSADPAVARAAKLVSALEPLDASLLGRPPPPSVLAARPVRIGPPRLAIAGALVFAVSIAAAAETARREGLFAPAAPVAAVPVITVSPSPDARGAGVEASAARVSGEAALILRGVRALQREGDPARAQALAEEALRTYPNGAQVEEAMTLAMESALARDDREGARAAARRYLSRFPGGRFADRARAAISRP